MEVFINHQFVDAKKAQQAYEMFFHSTPCYFDLAGINFWEWIGWS